MLRKGRTPDINVHLSSSIIVRANEKYVAAAYQSGQSIHGFNRQEGGYGWLP